jgi:hypothetical protein
MGFPVCFSENLIKPQTLRPVLIWSFFSQLNLQYSNEFLIGFFIRF